MWIPWNNKTGLAKATAILATIFTISLGLCGLNVLAMLGGGSSGMKSNIFVITAVLELAGIVLSLVGLLLVGLLFIFRRPPAPDREGPK